MASERGVYGSSSPSPDGHKIGTAGKIGLGIGFGLILVGLGGSLMRSAERVRPTEADLRRARIAARAYVVKQGLRG